MLIAILECVRDMGFCGAQWVSLPLGNDLVIGRVKCITGSPWWFLMRVKSEQAMCLVVLYLEMAVMVNSPKWMMQKKEVTIQAKMAVSLGSLRFMTAWNFSSMWMEKGAHLGHLIVVGVNLCAPLSNAHGSTSSMFHWRP